MGVLLACCFLFPKFRPTRGARAISRKKHVLYDDLQCCRMFFCGNMCAVFVMRTGSFSFGLEGLAVCCTRGLFCGEVCLQVALPFSDQKHPMDVNVLAVERTHSEGDCPSNQQQYAHSCSTPTSRVAADPFACTRGRGVVLSLRPSHDEAMKASVL